MAELVLGVGASHSPMVAMTGPDWAEWGLRDHEHPMLYTRDGRHLTYAEALDAATPELSARNDAGIHEQGAARVTAAVERLRSEIAAAALDVVVVVGDDQDEHLHAKNLPPFLVYWGDTIANDAVPDGYEAMGSMMQRFLAAYYETDGSRDYPVDASLARHLIDVALGEGFDVATSEELPEARGMGHAFGFPLRFLACRTDLPIVPVMVNTYNPPAQPRVTRCAQFGEMLRRAIGSAPGDARVGVVASGGLSHFMVLEQLDREVLEMLVEGDLEALCRIDEATFRAGTSEIKNWITVAACMAPAPFEVIDYVPGYRTPAGTGTGLGFGVWTPNGAGAAGASP